MSATGHQLRRRKAAENSNEAMEKRADVAAQASRDERSSTKESDAKALAAEVAKPKKKKGK